MIKCNFKLPCVKNYKIIPNNIFIANMFLVKSTRTCKSRVVAYVFEILLTRSK